MTIDEVAQVLQVSTDTVLFWTNTLHLPSHSISNFVRYRQDEIDKWVKENPKRSVAVPPTWNTKLGPQARNLDSICFFPTIRLPDEPSWLEDVLGGDFDAIPDPLVWDQAQGLALLIDGYGLAPNLGLGDCGEFANAKSKEARRSKHWLGSAVELWICQFFEQRRWRHFDSDPVGEDKQHLDALCTALRNALISESACTL